MRYIIDRFEGEFAVCEDEDMKIYNIIKKKFPSDAKEGDIFYFDGEILKLDIIETEKHRYQVEKLIESLFE